MSKRLAESGTWLGQVVPPSGRLDLLWLLLGSGLLALTTWRWNVPLAAWLAPVFLLRFSRRRARWYGVLLALPFMAAASEAGKWGAWGLDPGLEFVTGTLAILPLFLGLLADRFVARRLQGLAGTLVFPAVSVALDYGLSFMPLGTVFSMAPTQFHAQPLIQMASLTGTWGLSFVLLWLAPVANRCWEQGISSARTRLPVVVYAVSVVLLLLGGGMRMALLRPAAPTVRIAGVTVAHPRNYWDELVDRSTPEDSARALAPELADLEDDLFTASARAVAAGARIVFWSEGNAVLLPEHKEAFLRRAQAFAREHRIYLVPAYLALRYGQTTGDNHLAMIRPDGSLAYTYSKTKSWYATDSDGLLRSIDTPYGRIATAVCFDMDFPGLIRQAALQGADIMLVPAFDTLGTRPYHTEVGLLRALDYGFSVVRQTNQGASMAVDYQGRILAYQDYFGTDDPIMMADVPTRGVRTLYGLLGDWFAYLACAVAAITIVAAACRRERSVAPVSRLQTI